MAIQLASLPLVWFISVLHTNSQESSRVLTMRYLCVFNLLFVFSSFALPGHSEDDDVLTHAPGNPEGLYDYGFAFFKYEQYEKSSKVFELFLKKFPNNKLSPSALFHLGRSSELLGNNKEAWDAYNEVIRRFKKNRFWTAIARTHKGELEDELASQEK
jgi:tetratricopeptide (TPR) repeat protein